MSDVNGTPVTQIDQRRERRVSRALAARRRLDRAPFPARRVRAGGRVWVNGVEMGGTDPRHSTLAAAHD
jgi:hypothetical protein